MMIIMLSRFVEHVINGPPMRCRSAERTGGPSDVEQTSMGRELPFVET